LKDFGLQFFFLLLQKKQFLQSRYDFRFLCDGNPSEAATLAINAPLLASFPQFTLYAKTKKPKPDFSAAMPPVVAKEFYQVPAETT
jgi:D-Tyr-tRNAtyr deacylase